MENNLLLVVSVSEVVLLVFLRWCCQCFCGVVSVSAVVLKLTTGKKRQMR